MLDASFLLADVAVGAGWLDAGQRQAIVAAALAGSGYVLKLVVDAVAKRFQTRVEERAKVNDLRYLSAKIIELNRYAQHMLDVTGCDHTTIYAAANGEYLKSGDSIEKFVMQAEASGAGEPAYMDTEPIVYAHAIPQLVSKLFVADYVVMWPGQCEDEKANKNMRMRGYTTCIAMLITVPAPHGRFVLGLVALNWKKLILHPIKAQLPEPHPPFETFVTLKMQQAITRFKVECADLLDNKHD